MFKKLGMLTLSLVMMVGVIQPSYALEDDPIVYVSLGDSMTNGYGLDGYDGVSGVEDYGNESYANQFADYLGEDTIHNQLAMSSMRAEDLHWLLEFDYENEDAVALTEDSVWDETMWNEVFTTGDYWTFENIVTSKLEDAKNNIVESGKFDQDATSTIEYVAKYYQESVANADMISLGIGHTNFGSFVMDGILEIMSQENLMAYDIERTINELNPYLQKEILKLKDALYKEISNYLGTTIDGNIEGDDAAMEQMVNTVMYTAMSFAANYAGSVEAILELNEDAQIVLVALMNPLQDSQECEEVTLGQMMDLVLTPINAYIAAIPTMMQRNYPNATFYYAQAKDVDRLVETFSSEFKTDKIRAAFLKEIVGTEENPGLIWGMLVPTFNQTISEMLVEFGLGADTLELVSITLEDLHHFEKDKNLVSSNVAASCAIYKSLEEAVMVACDEGYVTIEALTSLVTNSEEIINNLTEALMSAFDIDAFTQDMTDFATNIVTEWIGVNGVGVLKCVPQHVRRITLDMVILFEAAYAIDQCGADFTGVTTEEEITSVALTAIAKKFAGGIIADILLKDNLLSNVLVSQPELVSVLHLFARCMVAGGMGGHPNATGHEAVYEAMKVAYEEGYTANEETDKNLEIVYEYLKPYFLELLEDLGIDYKNPELTANKYYEELKTEAALHNSTTFIITDDTYYLSKTDHEDTYSQAFVETYNLNKTDAIIEADLIALEVGLNEQTVDWSHLVSDLSLPYVQKALSKLYEAIDQPEPLKTIIYNTAEKVLYSYVEFAQDYALIKLLNPDATIVLVDTTEANVAYVDALYLATVIMDENTFYAKPTTQEIINVLNPIYKAPYILGDVNNDGTVNGFDSIVLNRYNAGWDIEINLDAADINEDGAVNGFDSILLNRHNAGWEGILN